MLDPSPCLPGKERRYPTPKSVWSAQGVAATLTACGTVDDGSSVLIFQTEPTRQEAIGPPHRIQGQLEGTNRPRPRLLRNVDGAQAPP